MYHNRLNVINKVFLQCYHISKYFIQRFYIENEGNLHQIYKQHSFARDNKRCDTLN